MAEDPIKHTIEKNKHGQVQYLDNLITEHLSDYRKHHPNAGYNTFRARIEEANPGVDWSHLKLGQVINIPMDLPKEEEQATATEQEQEEDTILDSAQEEDRAQGSGKQGKAGVYLIANDAECMCNMSLDSKAKDKFKVSSHKILHINDKDGDKKLLATTADLPLPFETPKGTFGKCKKQPSGASHNPCIPNIQKWENSYEAIRVEQAGGTALTEESEGKCVFGGTVTFFSTGQKEEITAADMAATPPAIVELATNGMLTKEQIEKMMAGEFEDEGAAGVDSIETADGKAKYHKDEKSIVLKVKEYTKGTPGDNQKLGINWTVYHKEKQSDPVYEKLYTFVDKGDSLEFPYRTTGHYAVEAYGHSEGLDPKTGEGGACLQLTIAHQGLDTEKGLQLQSDGEDRNGQRRVRPTETATIAVPMLFPKAKSLKPRDLYWEVTSKGEKLPFTKKGTSIVVPPLNNKKTKKVTATVTYEGTVKTMTYEVGHNYVKAIRSDKETISVLQHGEQQKERHQVTFEVSEYAMPYNAAKDAHLTIKWIAYHSKPDTGNQIGTGQKITKTSDKEGEWHVEAYVSTPQGAGKDTTTRIKAITPKLTKAYWANAEGHAIQKSGFGHKVYIHLETEGLQGEKLQPNIWYGRQGSDRYQKQQAPCIEITETNGMVNLAYKLPKYDKADNLDYFFTIENLEFPVEGTDQYPKAENELIISNNCTPKLLNVRRKKQITSLKMYEEGDKLHTGIVTYGDTVTIKVSTRNYIGETLEFEVWEDKKRDNHTDEYSTYDTWDDEKLPETVQIKIDSEGNGEASFTVPCDWENKHNKDKEGQPRYFYLKERESGEEFPRAYYVKNPNKTEEENKKNSQRIGALMLKVAKSLEQDKAKEKSSAVVLGEELVMEKKKEEKNTEDERAPWIKIAYEEMGVEEIAGKEHNEKILEYHNSSNSAKEPDEIPWCGAFVNWIMKKSDYNKGLPVLASKAVKWQFFGKKVPLESPPYGSIVVFAWTNDKINGRGHVGFLVSKKGSTYYILGGNQKGGDKNTNGKVCISAYKKANIISINMPVNYMLKEKDYEYDKIDKNKNGQYGTLESTR